jgi:hypothetical protein
MIKVKGGEGQEGGIAIGTGSAQAGEVCFDGKLYKPTDPEYNEVKKTALERFANRVSNIFNPNWK